MNLTLEALQILDTIARKGSFAAAAVELDRVPSALTYSVRKLEEDLDVLLFDRRGHRAKLTGAGLELLTEGRHLLLAAQELERRVKRAATGWEVELRIVLDSIIPFDSLLPLIEAFDRENAGTRLRISHETLSGVWEALLSDRADLVIGAPHGGPDSIRMSGGFQTRQLGTIEWVFAVAPGHPLANAPEPLTAGLIQQYRAVAVGDTSRSLPGITSGLLSGQDILTVPSIAAKLQAQLRGLGCGHLPRWMAAPYFASGALIEKQTIEAKPTDKTQIAWRTPVVGKSLKWFITQLSEPAIQHTLLGSPAPHHHESISHV
ncbi:LysR family transcriptional regulator [Collimonas sp. OK412]|jgi:DNA-binding transcriptional LysR family regulator|uniref:LysR family transcriptional regulator n=1 Tax=Collimonas sp. (strain OK412) TaxID=1801619 RepID=UPI0008E94879|nr:LysR family transcriptional regulator [Collimonas sp. OK412]SFC69007.1 DNA-binding transcriptional regulator, LysR family [Collimonas sp. OK412]